MLHRVLYLIPVCIASWGGAPSRAAADVLTLANGNRIEGRVEVLEDGQLEVTLDVGSVVTLRASEIRHRERGEAPLDELSRRFQSIRDGDRRAWIELAAWAELKGLRRGARDVYRKILRIDPHHEGARQQLGYVLHQNRWVRRSELQDQGLVRFRGAWHTPAEVVRIRRREAEAEFLTLLQDIHHDNRFIRENGRLRLIKVDDDRLVPLLIERLGGKSPVERLTCGDVLTNFGFQVAGEPLYHALIRETVPGCIDGFTALLGRFGKATLGVWVARDLERAATEPECLPRLIGLLENFPHRDAIGPLIEVMEKQRAWAVRIDRILSELLGVGSHTAGEWREIWAGMRDSVTVDLGTGWIGRRSTRR